MIDFFRKFYKRSVAKSAILKKDFIPFDLGKMLRIGNNKDGGYLVSNNGIKNCNFLLSLGLGFHWSFEKKFIELKNLENRLVMCYDNSVSIKLYSSKIIKNLLKKNENRNYNYR